MQTGEHNISGLYPLVLEPIFKYRIWGGRKLEKTLGKRLPPDDPIGESWETSCRGPDNNTIKNGHLAGKTLADIFATDREALIGSSLGEASRFPLLNKFIDANDLLSVQVHPNESVAAEVSGSEAKTEAWYVMDAEPGASLVKGLKPGVTRESFEKAIRENTVPDLINSVPVAAGDMVFVPAGCVHAMGKGLVVCEIQENSDTTYRVYDWGRVGQDGRPRELHVEQALRAINFEDRSPDKVKPVEVSEGANRRVYLVACNYFAMQTLILDETTTESTRGRRFECLMLTEGGAVVRTAGGEETRVAAGDSVLIPACLGDYDIAPLDRCELIRIFVPDIEAEIVDRLRSSGIAEEAIQGVVFH